MTERKKASADRWHCSDNGKQNRLHMEYRETSAARRDEEYNAPVGDDCFVNSPCVKLDCQKIRGYSGYILRPKGSVDADQRPLNVKIRKSGAAFPLALPVGDSCRTSGRTALNPGMILGGGISEAVESGFVMARGVPPHAAGNQVRRMRRLEEGTP